MVKGISRRVVVVDAPEHRFFEQAIFIVRNDAAGEGITSRELVEEARRVAHNYASSGTSRFSSRWRTLNPIVYTLIGAGTIGLAWLIVALAWKKARSLFERERAFLCENHLCSLAFSFALASGDSSFPAARTGRLGSRKNCLRTSSKGSTA